ncbi:MAG: WXG100 family type VII secretion target [Lachnospiraceae bacterium]|nr:WXG100 family type VII secretion target [Lachnospiraceae bacterium]
MSMFRVTASEMQSTITKLQSKNQDFLTKVQELNKVQQELSGMWTGDANTAFNNSYTANSARWTEFYNEINQYIEALSSALNTYITAEEENRETASKQSY